MNILCVRVETDERATFSCSVILLFASDRDIFFSLSVLLIVFSIFSNENECIHLSILDGLFNSTKIWREISNTERKNSETRDKM
jgi:hypothetical protein